MGRKEILLEGDCLLSLNQSKHHSARLEMENSSLVVCFFQNFTAMLISIAWMKAHSADISILELEV